MESTYGIFGFRDPDDFEKLAISYHDPNPSSLGLEFFKVLHAILHLNAHKVGALRKTAIQMCYRDDAGKDSLTKNNHELLSFLLCPSIIAQHIYFKPGCNAIRDSMWCEWAYVFDFMDRNLEIHRGGNKDPHAPGIYAAVKTKGSKYYGPRLVAKISLGKLIEGDVEGMKKIMADITYNTVKGKDLLGHGTQKSQSYKGTEILVF